MPITTLRMFILMCNADPNNTDLIYEMFEDDCTQALRDQIYSLADPKSPEPFRSAMINMGFPNY
jgi:hypothetical protein